MDLAERTDLEQLVDGAPADLRPFYQAPFDLLAAGRASDAALAKYEKAIAPHVPDPSALDELTGLAVVRSVISTDLPDAYRTVMDPTTLTNFAADAQEGRSVLYAHDGYHVVGKSFQGQLVRAKPARVESLAFVPGGVNLAGVSSDEVIRAMRLGTLHDVSVGFFGGAYRCSICGKSMWDYECTHVPGVEYVTDEKKGTRATAWVRIEGAHLAEYSFVFDGATPGATILGLKAKQEADAGRLVPTVARMLETQYRGLRLPNAYRLWSAAAPAPTQEDDVTLPRTRRAARETTPPNPPAPAPEPEEDEEDGAEEEDGTVAPGTGQPTAAAPAPAPTAAAEPATEAERTLGRLRAVLARHGVAAEDLVAAVRGLATEIARLKPLAATGEHYRTVLVEDALAELVRAHGDAAPLERYQALFARATTTVEEIEAFRDDWIAQAQRQFPGGRQTTEGPPPAKLDTAVKVPAAAHRAR